MFRLYRIIHLSANNSRQQRVAAWSGPVIARLFVPGVLGSRASINFVTHSIHPIHSSHTPKHCIPKRLPEPTHLSLQQWVPVGFTHTSGKDAITSTTITSKYDAEMNHILQFLISTSDSYPEGLGNILVANVPSNHAKYRNWLQTMRGVYSDVEEDLDRNVFTMSLQAACEGKVTPHRAWRVELETLPSYDNVPERNE